MTTAASAKERWLAALLAPAPRLSWAALLRPAMATGLSAAALVAAVARTRVAGRSSPSARPDVAAHDLVTVIRLPPVRRADDLAEAASAANALAREAGWSERIGWGRLGPHLRTPESFQSRILDPLLGLGGVRRRRLLGECGAEPASEWRERCRFARLHALALSRFERADGRLRHALAEWVGEEPWTAPFLVLDCHAGRHTVLITNCPPPPPPNEEART